MRSQRRRGIALQTTAEPDRARAIDGADVVITCLSVGGFDSMQHDIEIPRRYGIRQPIGDSVGPGGLLRALRSVPVMVDIARDVEKLAPDAWFVNVTNPLTALCRSVTRETAVKTVGLCNEWVGAIFNLSLALDCGMHELDPVLAGVNHFPIATELRVGGEDVFARLLALMDDPERAATETIWMDPLPDMHWIKTSPSEFWSKLDVIENNRVRFEVLRRFGVFPGSGDHHSVEFMPGFVHPGNDYGEPLADPPLRDGGPPGRRGLRRGALRVGPRRAGRLADAFRRARGEPARRLRDRYAPQPPGEPPERRQRHQPARPQRGRDHGRCRRDRGPRSGPGNSPGDHG